MRRLFPVLPFSALALAFLANCSSDGPDEGPAVMDTVGVSDATGPYGIRVFIKNSAGMTEHRIGPMKQTGPVDFSSLIPAGSEVGTAASPLMRTMGGPGPALEAGGEFSVDPSVHSATLLLTGAARMCGVETPTPEELMPYGPWGALNWFVFADIFTVYPDKSGGPQGTTLRSCDDGLLRAQQLVCMADKLAELAASPVPVEWDLPGVKEVWIFPTPEPRSEFIVRDLALTTLAHLARMDFEKPAVEDANTIFPEPTCAAAYASLVEKPELIKQAKYWTKLFEHVTCGDQLCSSPELSPTTSPADLTDGVPLITERARMLALGRLHFNTKLLATGAALLKDLVETSVCADVAGAYSKMASAQDPSEASRQYWGVADDADAPYNSAAHALRVLFGRLEMGDPTAHAVHLYTWATTDTVVPVPPVSDPMCGGYFSLTAVQNGALGEAASARWQDRSISTLGQENATRLLRGAGIVISPDAIDDGTISIDDARTAITQQLQYNAAREQSKMLPVGVSAINPEGAFSEPHPSDPLELQAGGVIARKMDEIHEADLRFAIDRVASAYRQFSDEPEALQVSSSMATVDAALVAPEIEGLNTAGAAAFVLEQPLIGDLPGDPFAKAAGLQAAAQCPTLDRGATNSAVKQNYFDRPHVGMANAFQDPFMLGDTLRRRIHNIRNLMQAADDATWPETGDQTARADIERYTTLQSAAIRAWAGPARARLEVRPGRYESRPGPWGGWSRRAVADNAKLRISGLAPKDLGVEALGEMKGRIALVYGEPWVADCAAGTRQECPDGFFTDYVQLPTIESDPVEDPGLYDGAKLEMTFHVRGTKAKTRFRPEFALFGPWGAASQPVASFIYLIALPDAERALDGEVLGAFAPRQPVSARATISLPDGSSQSFEAANWPFEEVLVTEIAISNMQRKLARQVLGISKEWSDPRVGNSSSATSLGYCIKGPSCVFGEPKDIFVPLENELTSDNDQFEDSYRHYIDRARQAALHADQLGKELIQLKSGQYERMEGAQERVGAICGDYTAVEKIEVDNMGGLSSPDNEPTSSCLNEESFDLVFLTEDQLEQYSDADDKLAHLGCDKDTRDKDGIDGPYSEKLCERIDDLGGVDELDTAGLTDLSAPDVPDAVPCNAAVRLAITHGGEGPIEDLAQIAAEDFAAPTSVLAALTPLRMVVEDDGNWSLKYGSQIFMATSLTVAAGEPEPVHIWPYCQLKGKSRTACKNTSPDGAEANGLNFAFMFDTIDPISLPLDEYPAAHKAYWRQQVEAVLWTMGAIGGSMPAGRISLPIPATSWNDEFTDPVPAAMLYTPGKFNTTPSSGGEYKLLENDHEAAVVGPGVLPKEIYVAGLLRAEKEKPGTWPTWLVETYKDWQETSFILRGNRLLHVDAKNVQRDFRKSPAYEMGISTYLSSLATQDCSESVFDDLKWPSARANVCPTKNPSLTYLEARRGVVGLSDMYWTRLAAHGSIQGIVHGEASDSAVTQTPNRCLEFGDRFEAVTNWALNGCLENSPGLPADCRHKHESDRSSDYVSAGCVVDTDFYKQYKDSGRSLQYYLRRTRTGALPSNCSPDQRVDVFTNSHFVRTACEGRKQVAQALALSCMATPGGSAYASMITGEEPPPITTEDDLAYLYSWLHRQADTLYARMAHMWLRDIPKRAVRDYLASNAGTGSTGGEYGRAVLKLGGSLSDIGILTDAISSDLRKAADLVENTMRDLRTLKLENDRAARELAMRQMRAQMQILKGAIAIASAIPGLTPDTWGAAAGKMGTGVADIGEGGLALDILEQIESLEEDLKNNAVLAVMQRMNGDMAELYALMETHLGGLRKAALDANSTSSQIKSLRDEAQYQIAKGSGAGYLVEDGSGLVTFPVNQVNNRLFHATRIRYEQALDNAKYLGYLARLAIEMRLGVKMNEMNEPIGSLSAPSDWADSVCTLSGVSALKAFAMDGESDDMDVLFEDVKRAFEEGDPVGEITPAEADELEKIEDAIIEGFAANGYIGDYIDQLDLLVEYYNLEYPFQEGDDMMVLSLRDDLVTSAGVCGRTSRNLLFYSDQLGQAAPAPDRGWFQRSCEGTRCLNVSVEPNADFKRPFGIGGVTWLSDLDVDDLEQPEVEEGSSEGEDPLEPEQAEVTETWAPSRANVYQKVRLTPGTYVLSWWDQAGDMDESATAKLFQTGPYRTRVFGPDEGLVATMTAQPALPGTTGKWSERHSLTIEAETSGDYWVSFTASDGDDYGRVAIANVQLERSDEAGKATAYDRTDSSRQVITSDCMSGSPEAFRDAFDYDCDELGCFYELRLPVSINTQVASREPTTLLGRLAIGNRNYRHVTLALNVVGYGVLDCSETPSPSCFSQGYVEYDLRHTAQDVPILSHSDPHRFNFGTGQILRGKGVAAERYITLPLGSTDQSLISQVEIEKRELRGRPLSGSYYLKIYESPALSWENVEDIQLVTKYHYWSPVVSEN